MTGIELTRIELKQIHDKIYDIADTLIKKFDPCEFHNGKCIQNRSKDYSFGWEFNKNGCCTHDTYILCKYHKKGKCNVKSLGCKLFLCLRHENTPLYKALLDLKGIALMLGIDSRICRTFDESNPINL